MIRHRLYCDICCICTHEIKVKKKSLAFSWRFMYVIGILTGILRSEDFLILAFDLQTDIQKTPTFIIYFSNLYY